MVKFILRICLLLFMSGTVAVTSLSVFRPKELYRDQVAVLMYHHVHDQDKSSGTVTTKLFRDQLTYLKSKSYHFITLDELKAFMKGSPVPSNAVLITFDDGYESFYQNAYPILNELHIPAVNFIITGTIDDPLSGNIPFMSRKELQSLYAAKGVADIECHTDALHDKLDGKALLTQRIPVSGNRTENTDEYKSRITADAQACVRKVNEVYPGSGNALAYPFGIYNEEAADALKAGGIKMAFTIMPKMTTRESDPMRIPRINAGSPYVEPETLHNMIMRRVSAVKHPHDTVPLRETVEQIGGELFKGKEDGSLHIGYNGMDYRFRPDKSAVIGPDGTEIKLKEPLKVMGNRSYIDLQDLQLILKLPIYFDASTQTYTTQPPERSDVDHTEGMKLPQKGG
ncbi:polysaccharide deacetylase family protein [Gorillibacterium sp. sgz5001074]|uniref:polysaccharide deacetylase family protein n=1 Tax=Gorillibacterium sp. sgz5001074 TaxID=3446695 RepID=UPI003F6800E1